MTEADLTAWKEQIMAHVAIWDKCPPEAAAKAETLDKALYEKNHQENFAKSDSNGDGVLDREEFRVYMDRDQQFTAEMTGFDQAQTHADHDSFFDVLCKHGGCTSVSLELLNRYNKAFDTLTAGM